MPSPASDWLTELELDPTKSPVAMGTRSLGDRPWLIVDEYRQRDLALKAELCANTHDDVFGASESTERAGVAVVDLIEREGVTVPDALDLHPLDRAGRSVQEDLCLMERSESGWYLAAGSVCFPSRWRLSDKLGRHVAAVHAPVDNYHPELEARVDQLLDRLAQPVWRRNWFVHSDPTLHQPTRPDVEPTIAAGDVLTDLYVRSERQVLRSVGPPGWLLFSIRTQQAQLGAALDDPGLRVRFARYLHAAPDTVLAHRGMSTLQVVELRQTILP